jgi:hypothetical protein
VHASSGVAAWISPPRAPTGLTPSARQAVLTALFSVSGLGDVQMAQARSGASTVPLGLATSAR